MDRLLPLVLIVTFVPTCVSAQDAGDVSRLPRKQLPQEDVHARLEMVEAQLRALQEQSTWAVPATSPYQLAGCTQCGKSGDGCFCDGGQGLDATKGMGDGFPTAKLTGVFQLDWGAYSQDLVNRDTLGDIEDGLAFRRIRFAATGKVTERTSYILEFDFAQDQPRIVDVWMQFAETPVGKIRIGRYRQPFGMAEPTSIRELPFLERPLTFALAPFRQTGIMLFDTAFDERMTWAVSGYRFLSDAFGNVYADTGGYGMATRLTFLPLEWDGDKLVHLGVDYSYNDPGRNLMFFASTNEFFVGQNPNLALSGFSVLPIIGVPPFVNTGAIPTERTNLFNVEGAFSLGRLLIQSEARWAVVDQTNGVTNTFPGAYAHVRYVLTGETIPYNHANGVFGRVKPAAPVDFWCGQYGAWELAARVSYLDLNGEALPGPGRRLVDTTIGLNWYVNDYTKFQLNWIHSNLNDPTLGDSVADTFAMRGQLDF